MELIYLLDNSAIFDLKPFYPSESFPSFWEKFKQLVESGRCYSIDEVESEIKNYHSYDEELKKEYPFLIFRQKQNFFISPSNKMMKFFKENLEKEYRNDSRMKKNKPYADPMLIAQAGAEGHFLVTHENRDREKGIPKRCQKLGIQCGTIANLIEREGWVF